MVIIVVKLSRQWLAGKVQTAANGAAKMFEKSYFMQAKLRGLYHFFFYFFFSSSSRRAGKCRCTVRRQKVKTLGKVLVATNNSTKRWCDYT